MKNLVRVMYTSRAYGHVDEAEIDELLETSRSRNYTKGITGALSFGNGSFMQVLEGPETEVIPLYARIIADPRHRDCVILSINLIRDRLFSNWSMGYVSDFKKIAQNYNELLDYRSIREDKEDTLNTMNILLEILRD